MSATVLRELIAKLGFQVDEAGFKKAATGVERAKQAVAGLDSKLRDARSRFGGAGRQLGQGAADAASGTDKLSKSAGSFGSGMAKLLGGLALGAAIREVVKLASDANETDNVLGEVFGAEGAQRVKDWAESTSKEVGRSRFALREMAGQLGAMLEPMTGSATKAEEMSTTFSKLAVDLASFFNTSDSDALLALKSGLTGETEPLRRYGIVLLDATLAEYAHSKGIAKKVSAMSVAEKTELRYQYILAHTTKAQGDAARTADGFANASRALKDKIRDVSTELGQKLLPYANKLVKAGSQIIDVFLDISKNSTLVESAIGVLTAAMLVFSSESLIAFGLPALAIAALILLVDDLNQLFTGGESAIGEWLDTTFGIGTAQELVDGFKQALERVIEVWGELTALWQSLPDLTTMWEVATGSVEEFGASVAEQFQRVGQWIDETLTKLANLGRAFARALGFKAPDKQADAFGQAEGRGSDDGVKQREDRAAARREALYDRVEANRRKRADDLAQMRADSAERVKAGGLALGQVRVSAGPGQVSAAAALGTRPGAGPVVNNGPININVAGGAGAGEAARAARQAAQAERRRTQEALERVGG